MKIEEFILIYKTKSNEEKEKFIAEHITTKYISFSEKLMYCNKIAENTLFVTDEEGENKRFKQNSPSKFLFTNLILIKLYSDLEINFEKDPIKCFDLLNENGLIIGFIQEIPETEYAEFQTLLNMVIDDIIVNERDLVSYIENKIDVLHLSLNTLLDSLKDIKPEEKDEEKNI